MIQNGFIHKQYGIVVLTDISKACCTANHPILLHKLYTAMQREAYPEVDQVI